MLSYLNIKNFVLIKDLELDLYPEMTVFTGETGAGKSIIIDTLLLALGARTDTSVIRPGADRCEITAIFDIKSIPRASKWLVDHEMDSDNECILSRTINKDGRSKSAINGQFCTQQILRSLSELLIDIHGQHEHQALLNPERQRELLDAFGDHKNLCVDVKNLYTSWHKTKKELDELGSAVEDYPTKIEFLNYQLNELKDIDLSPHAIEKLRQDYRRLSNIEQITANFNAALAMLTEDDSRAICTNLYNAKNQLEKASSLEPKIINAVELLKNAIIQTEEASAEIRHQLDAIELDEERKQQVEKLMVLIHDLARKHQAEPEELSLIYSKLEEQLQTLQGATNKIKQLEIKVKELEQAYLKAATELGNKRKLAGKKLSAAVSDKMELLAMSGGKFTVNFTPQPEQSYHANGLEKIEFLVSANPGQPLQPLAKVVSGGELSRISLAIQVITAEKEVTPTLIFDEVDTGIGGKTADIVGQLLRKLGKKTQVICVTHLPQVATQGNHHLLVEKIPGEKKTEVKVIALNKKERINEIARMLGGVKITQQTLAHAEEMLKQIGDN